LIAHPTNISVALEAAKSVGLPKSSVLIFGNEAVDGVLPYKQVLLGARQAVPVEISEKEAEDTVAYLCFSSGTTGTSYYTRECFCY
jgi:acyl-coenzyme A synthetase/AMP-(fatty) acid ligase